MSWRSRSVTRGIVRATTDDSGRIGERQLPSILRPSAMVALTAALCTSAVLAILHGGDEALAGAASERPNIILVVTDDQTRNEFSPRTMPAAATLLGREGTIFTKAIVSTPACCPSRATMLTGQYAHNHGVTSNAPGYERLSEKRNTLPVWLSRAGYRTAHLGKYLNGYERRSPAPGWEEWHTLVAPRQYYGYRLAVNGTWASFGHEPGDHLTHVLNRRATRLVRRFSDDGDPFYIQIDHFAPHSERGRSFEGRCGGGAVPDPRDLRSFSDEPLPMSPSFNEADVSDKPSFISSGPRLDRWDRAQIERRYRCRLRSLSGVDRGIRKLVDKLEQLDELEDTAIIFVSDNGYFHGEHRIRLNKVLPYEEALGVPLVIRAPASVTGREPVPSTAQLTSNVDLAPTILDLANAEPCVDGECRVMDGRSLVPLLRADDARFPSGRGILVEWARAGERPKPGTPCEYSGVRTRDSTYVEYSRTADSLSDACVDSGERELYELTADPFQLENLLGGLQPGSPPGPRKSLEDRLESLRDCAGIAGRDPPSDDRPHCE
jgi:N-acetylglucosamine-6-sulfatase